MCCGSLMEIERSWPQRRFEDKVFGLHVQTQRGLGRDLYRGASVCDIAHSVVPFFSDTSWRARACGDSAVTAVSEWASEFLCAYGK